MEQEKWINIYYDEKLATERVYPQLYPTEDVAKQQGEYLGLDVVATVKINFKLNY